MPAAPVERQHELPAQALAQRMAAYERVELRDELDVAPEGQVRLDALLQAGEVLLGQSALPRAARTAPRTPQGPGRARARALRGAPRRPRGLDPRERLAPACVELLEAAKVERVSVELDEVAGRARAQQPVRAAASAGGRRRSAPSSGRSPARRRPRGRRRADPSERPGRREAAAAPASAFCLPPASLTGPVSSIASKGPRIRKSTVPPGSIIQLLAGPAYPCFTRCQAKCGRQPISSPVNDSRPERRHLDGTYAHYRRAPLVRSGVAVRRHVLDTARPIRR